MSENEQRVYGISYDSNDGAVTLLRSDGGIIVRFVVGAEAGQGKIPTSLIRYSYTENANPPPNDGQVRTDAPTVADTTKVYVNRLDYDNRDRKFLFMQLVEGDQLFYQDMNNSDAHAFLTLTTDAVDDGDYVTFNVKCDSFSGVVLEGTGILMGAIF